MYFSQYFAKMKRMHFSRFCLLTTRRKKEKGKKEDRGRV
uniref:Uncharacterized protein n=1 Tax=Manihot esculenta TaxID=3983 RepID=A0A2C9W4B9_MANES